MRTGIVAGALGILLAAIAAQAADTSVLTRNHPVEVDSLPAVGIANPNQVLSMQVRLALRNQRELDRLLAAQHEPSSANYRRWLTPNQFNRKFGARQADADAIAQWLRGFGFTIESANAADGFISFSGTVAPAQQAFGVSIATYGTGKFFANTADPRVPSRFAAIIDAVTGLDNMTLAVPTLSTVRRASPEFQFNGHRAFGPNDLYTFYDEGPLLSSATGNDQCIAIVGVSDLSDDAVSGFNNRFGLPTTALTRREISGGAPRSGGDTEIEAELDVEWSHAAAPGAPIRLYLGGGPNDLIDAITAAVNENVCGVISISFGFCGGSRALFTKTLGGPFKKAAATGQSVFVSSGDQGAAGIVFDPALGHCVVGKSLNPSEMAANPNVIAVGGSGFDPNYDPSGNDLGNVPERVWNDPPSGFFLGGASGGGISKIFAKPSYQKGILTGGKRDIPDIALIASPIHPGVFIDNQVQDIGLDLGTACCLGGTSLSAPVWAGFTRVISDFFGGRIGNINYEIYRLATQSNPSANGFRDVTSGDNSFKGVNGYPAQPGYDRATGWGTIDVSTFANAFKALPIGKLGLAPRVVNLGKVTNGQTSLKPKIAKLTNPAKDRLQANVSAIDITPNPGTPAGAFVIDNSTTTCISTPTPPKQNCTIGVKFSPPSGSSGPMSAKLSVTDNGSNSPQTATLKGIAK